MVPALMLITYFGGYGTLLEAAAVTVVAAILVECLVYRNLHFRRDVSVSAVESATLVGGFLVVLATALGLTNYVVDAEVPAMALTWVREHIHSPLLFPLALNYFLSWHGAWLPDASYGRESVSLLFAFRSADPEGRRRDFAICADPHPRRVADHVCSCADIGTG